MLLAGRSYVNTDPETETAVCDASERESDVIQGVMVVTLRPDREKVVLCALGSGLIATMATPPPGPGCL
jgi:exosome complex RNA-binding protein Rrp42 (RNase PH superfamily)